MNKEFSRFDQIPFGRASDTITKGCLVLEGGAFRAVYGEGVLDAFMLEDINMECTIGVSAGAMNGLNYVAGHIGRAIRFNLEHRYDSSYVGIKAVQQNKGVIGFKTAFDDDKAEEPLDIYHFYNTPRKFYAVCTNVLTGKPEYFEKNSCSDIFQAIRASASMPALSAPVPLDASYFLDGGCSNKVPIEWALEQGYEKIVVVRTQHKGYRKKELNNLEIDAINRFYKEYPLFADALSHSAEVYNAQCDLIEKLEEEGRIFVIYPSEPLDVGRLEPDLEKLGDVYFLGYANAKEHMAKLKEYLDLAPSI